MPMSITEKDVQEQLTLLEATYKRIKLRTSDVDEPVLHQAPAKGEWSIAEILVHLISCADVWAYSIDAMLTLDQPTLAHIHPRDWAAIKIYRKQPFSTNWHYFEANRKRLLLILQALAYEQWQHTAIIKGREYSVYSQVRRMAKHENEHCDQIEEILSRLAN